MARHERRLQVLAGRQSHSAIEPSTSDYARLFDMLVGHYRYVVVDASSRLDSVTRLVSNLSEKILLVARADVASLWSAGRVAAISRRERHPANVCAGAEPFSQGRGLQRSRSRSRHRGTGAVAHSEPVLRGIRRHRSRHPVMQQATRKWPAASPAWRSN